MGKIITEILPEKLNQNEVIDEISLAHIGVNFVKALEKKREMKADQKRKLTIFRWARGIPRIKR
mgnify:CR=1 FL=1